MKLAVAVLAGLMMAVIGAVAGLGAIDTAARAIAPAPESAAAAGEIPAELIDVYQGASTACEGLPWQVLAAIFWVESRHGSGRADPATGNVFPPIIGPAIDGRPGFATIRDPSSPDGWAHALGPGQFLSTTWARWASLAPGRPKAFAPDPHNLWDAAYSAGRKLCGGRTHMGDLKAAILSYNRSDSYYDTVWAKAIAYGMAPDGSATVGVGSSPIVAAGPGRMFSADSAVVVKAALSQLGVPYRWGGVTPGVALDCSGLVVIAFRSAGVKLPRTTAGQVDVGTPVDPGEALLPGDLLFFRGGRPTRDLGHVAIYAGDDLMVIAPRTGEVVSLRPVPKGAIQAIRRVLMARANQS